MSKHQKVEAEVETEAGEVKFAKDTKPSDRKLKTLLELPQTLLASTLSYLTVKEYGRSQATCTAVYLASSVAHLASPHLLELNENWKKYDEAIASTVTPTAPVVSSSETGRVQVKTTNPLKNLRVRKLVIMQKFLPTIFEDLVKMKSLQELEVQQMVLVVPASIYSFKRLDKLKSLSLGNACLDERLLGDLPESLRHLEIGDTYKTRNKPGYEAEPSGFSATGFLSSEDTTNGVTTRLCPQLESLKISSNHQWDLLQLYHIAHHCPNLTRLDILDLNLFSVPISQNFSHWNLAFSRLVKLRLNKYACSGMTIPSPALQRFSDCKNLATLQLDAVEAEEETIKLLIEDLRNLAKSTKLSTLTVTMALPSDDPMEPDVPMSADEFREVLKLSRESDPNHVDQSYENYLSNFPFYEEPKVVNYYQLLVNGLGGVSTSTSTSADECFTNLTGLTLHKDYESPHRFNESIVDVSPLKSLSNLRTINFNFVWKSGTLPPLPQLETLHLSIGDEGKIVDELIRKYRGSVRHLILNEFAAISSDKTISNWILPIVRGLDHLTSVIVPYPKQPVSSSKYWRSSQRNNLVNLIRSLKSHLEIHC